MLALKVPLKSLHSTKDWQLHQNPLLSHSHEMLSKIHRATSALTNRHTWGGWDAISLPGLFSCWSNQSSQPSEGLACEASPTMWPPHTTLLPPGSSEIHKDFFFFPKWGRSGGELQYLMKLVCVKTTKKFQFIKLHFIKMSPTCVLSLYASIPMISTWELFSSG